MLLVGIVVGATLTAAVALALGGYLLSRAVLDDANDQERMP